MRILLIGFMGAGKSSVARLLADRLNLKLIELDQLIVDRSGCKSAVEIFERLGEARFRELESEVCSEVSDIDQALISPGGGALSNPDNAKLLTGKKTKVVYLRTSFSTLQARLKDDTNRFLFRDPIRAKQLYDQRCPGYESLATFCIDTDTLSIEDTTNIIISYLTDNQ